MRTDADAVKGLVETTLDDATINNFIAIASAVIDRFASRCSQASATVLAHMETLLAAHMVESARSNKLTERKFGDSSEKYADRSSGITGLDATLYGQQLKMLDPCGIIGSMDKMTATTVLL